MKYKNALAGGGDTMRAAIIRCFGNQKTFAKAVGVTSYRVSAAITGLMPLSLEEATLWACYRHMWR
jgi:hypothetical protein